MKHSHLRALALACLIAMIVLAAPAAAQGPADSIDVVLVVDTSGSMKQNDPDAVRVSAAKLFVDLTGEGDRVALVNLGGPGDKTEILDLTEIGGSPASMLAQKRRIKEKLDTLAAPVGRGTLMGTALSAAYDILDRTPPGRRQYVVMLTDGKPDGEKASVLDNAVNLFEAKRFWKIFPIALGKDADYDFLSQQVAGRTAGRAYKAETPAELIRVYTEIFALLRYNRYVNWVSVEPNNLQTILSLTPDQKVTDLALVIPKDGDKPAIDVLLAPAGANIVDPAYAAGVYHAGDARYEAYLLNKDSTPLEGEWKTRMLSDKPVDMAVLTRSDFGIQLAAPSPQFSWDELSERYQPLGEPLFVQVSVRNAGKPSSVASQPQSLAGKPELYLSPMVRMATPQWDPLVLRDDGLEYDAQKDDGNYSGMYRAPDQPGDYVLEIEVPARKEAPFRLVKSRTFIAMALPSLKLTLPPYAPSQTEVSVAAELQSPAGAAVTVSGVDFTLWLRDPLGKASTLLPAGGGGKYTASFPVSNAGQYAVWATALVRASVEERDISYTSVAFGTYSVPTTAIAVEPAEVDLGQLGEMSNVPVKVKLTSSGLVAETVAVQVDGLDKGVVKPEQVTVQPGQNEVELRVGSTAIQPSGPGEFDLVFTSPQGTATVEGGKVRCTYTIQRGMTISSQDPQNADLGEIDSTQEMKVTVLVKSESAQMEPLAARVEGFKDVTVFPPTIQVPPREETPFTFAIAGKGGVTPGEFRLILSSPNNVPLVGAEIAYKYKETTAPPFLLCVCLPLLLLALAVGAFVFVRRRRRATA